MGNKGGKEKGGPAPRPTAAELRAMGIDPSVLDDPDLDGVPDVGDVGDDGNVGDDDGDIELTDADMKDPYILATLRQLGGDEAADDEDHAKKLVECEAKLASLAKKATQAHAAGDKAQVRAHLTARKQAEKERAVLQAASAAALPSEFDGLTAADLQDKELMKEMVLLGWKPPPPPQASPPAKSKGAPPRSTLDVPADLADAMRDVEQLLAANPDHPKKPQVLTALQAARDNEGAVADLKAAILRHKKSGDAAAASKALADVKTRIARRPAVVAAVLSAARVLRANRTPTASPSLAPASNEIAGSGAKTKRPEQSQPAQDCAAKAADDDEDSIEAVEATDDDLQDPEILAEMARLGGAAEPPQPAATPAKKAPEEVPADDDEDSIEAVEATDEDLQDPEILAEMARLGGTAEARRPEPSPPKKVAEAARDASEAAGGGATADGYSAEYDAVEATDSDLQNPSILAEMAALAGRPGELEPSDGREPEAADPHPSKEASPSRAEPPSQPASSAPAAGDSPGTSTPHGRTSASTATPAADAAQQASPSKRPGSAHGTLSELSALLETAVRHSDAAAEAAAAAARDDLQTSLAALEKNKADAQRFKEAKDKLKEMHSLKQRKQLTAAVEQAVAVAKCVLDKGSAPRLPTPAGERDEPAPKVHPSVLQLADLYDFQKTKAWSRRHFDTCAKHWGAGRVEHYTAEAAWALRMHSAATLPSGEQTVSYVELESLLSATYVQVDLPVDLSLCALALKADQLAAAAVQAHKAGDAAAAKSALIEKKRATYQWCDTLPQSRHFPVPEPEEDIGVDERVKEFFKAYDVPRTRHWSLTKARRAAKHCGAPLVSDEDWEAQCSSMGHDPKVGIPARVIYDMYSPGGGGGADIERDLRLSRLSFAIEKLTHAALAARNRGEARDAEEKLKEKKQKEAERAAILRAEEEAKAAEQRRKAHAAHAEKQAAADKQRRELRSAVSQAERMAVAALREAEAARDAGNPALAKQKLAAKREHEAERQALQQQLEAVKDPAPPSPPAGPYDTRACTPAAAAALGDPVASLSEQIRVATAAALEARSAQDMPLMKQHVATCRRLKAELAAASDEAAAKRKTTDTEQAQPPAKRPSGAAAAPGGVDERVKLLFDRYDTGRTGHWNLEQANRCALHLNGPVISEDAWQAQCASLGLDAAAGLPAALVYSGYAEGGQDIRRDLRLSDLSLEIDALAAAASVCHKRGDMQGCKAALADAKRKRAQWQAAAEGAEPPADGDGLTPSAPPPAEPGADTPAAVELRVLKQKEQTLASELARVEAALATAKKAAVEARGRKDAAGVSEALAKCKALEAQRRAALDNLATSQLHVEAHKPPLDTARAELEKESLESRIQAATAEAYARRDEGDIPRATAALKRKRELEAELKTVVSKLHDERQRGLKYHPKVKQLFDLFDARGSGHWLLADAEKAAKHCRCPAIGEKRFAEVCTLLKQRPDVGIPLSGLSLAYAGAGVRDVDVDLRSAALAAQAVDIGKQALRARADGDAAATAALIAQKKAVDAQRAALPQPDCGSFLDVICSRLQKK
ncbi:hypothetical protein DIPPA_24997 [Diplonema papillatum]|nr:hypothetical protein DIPPA_24997 [Diplonema papillatum]